MENGHHLDIESEKKTVFYYDLNEYTQFIKNVNLILNDAKQTIENENTADGS